MQPCQQQYPHHSSSNEWLSLSPPKHITLTLSLSCMPLLRCDQGCGVWLLANEDGVDQHRLILLRTVDACCGRQGRSSTSAPEEPDPTDLPPPSPCSPLSTSLFCFRLLYDIPSSLSLYSTLLTVTDPPFSSFLAIQRVLLQVVRLRAMWRLWLLVRLLPKSPLPSSLRFSNPPKKL